MLFFFLIVVLFSLWDLSKDIVVGNEVGICGNFFWVKLVGRSGRGEEVAPPRVTVVQGVVKVKMAAKGKQRRMAHRRESGEGGSIVSNCMMV